MHVPEQELTKQEEQAYLRAAEEELIKEFPGDNESVNCIRDAVVIREEYQEGHVEAEWSFDNYRLIESRTGRIVGEPDEEGELVNVQVTLTCGKSRCVQEFYICVYPRLLDEEERFRKGNFRKDCADSSRRRERTDFFCRMRWRDIPYTGSKGAIRDRKRSLYWA